MIVPCSKLWPAVDASPDDARLHWGRVAGVMVGAMPIANPLARPLLLAIRGAKLGDEKTHELVHRPAYDDCFVLLQRDAAPMAFDAAAHAYQLTSKLSPKEGVGSVRPGRFVAHLVSGNEPEVVFWLKTPEGSPRLLCFRDLNRDGNLTDGEKQTSEELRAGGQVGAEGTWADSILIHGGIEEPKDAKHHFSIGCWTAPRKWRKVMADACRAAGVKELDAILAEASDIVIALDAADRRDFGDSDVPPPPENVA